MDSWLKALKLQKTATPLCYRHCRRRRDTTSPPRSALPSAIVAPINTTSMSASSTGAQMTTPGSRFANHGPTHLPVLRLGSGPDSTSSDPSSGPERRPSNTPARFRANGAAPYPPTLATPDGDAHNMLIGNPTGPLEVMNPRLRESNGPREEELRQRRITVAMGNGIQAM